MKRYYGFNNFSDLKKIAQEDDDIEKYFKSDLSYDTIWYLGNRISGGAGFWGSFDMMKNKNPKEMIKAWVDGLRELGYSDTDIVLYGDWTDGRHIADYIESDTTYDEFKKIVKENARDPKEVHTENVEGYADKIREWKIFLF